MDCHQQNQNSYAHAHNAHASEVILISVDRIHNSLNIIKANFYELKRFYLCFNERTNGAVCTDFVCTLSLFW